MRPRDLLELVALAALWGASFLFMRVAAADFGAVALSGVRVAGAALFLVPLLAMRGQLGALREHAGTIALVGITNSALPFLAYSFAALSITAGLSSIFNATTPLWGAVIAWWWLGDRPTRSRMLGLALGFAGVLGLAWDKASFKPGAEASGWAVLACLAATLLYGWSANYTRKRLGGVPPLALATGSQLSAALVLAVPTGWWWPATTPSPASWTAAAMLAVVCTGMAYLLYFRLIARLGPARALTVTYLIPVFAVAWGWLLLRETLTTAMLIGGAVILLGTALGAGVV
ncbi:MAG: DMT family transporter [Burkholderiaceae bacterium]